MAALVSSLHQGETTKMPPITSILSSETETPKSPKKSVNGDTKGFFPPRQSSKKKLKWSIDRLKSENSSENEKNKSNDVKSKLTSKSASSFFSPKPVITPDHEEDEQKSPTDSASLANSFENRNSSDLEKHDDSRCETDDESLLMTPQDPSLARQSTGSINFIDKVVQEILSTEKTYVNNLKEIIEGYLQCMRMKNCPISKENVKYLFINIEKIYEFNRLNTFYTSVVIGDGERREFLKQIENADEDPVEIADYFVKNETGFQTYTEYCTNYPKSVEVLTECTRQRDAASFIQEIQMNLGHSLPLGSYLLKPVQRILKYHLLLQEMKKRFDKENDADGFDIICDALFAMTDVARYINEMKRQHEATLHVQEIQSQLSEFEGPDLTTYGNLVLEDTFRVVGTRTDRYLFLFEKILLITKKRERENGYTCKASLLLSNMMMTESLPKEPLAFQIIRFDNQKITYQFMARSMDQKNKWTLALKKLLVESLVAEVPLKAKALILGERNVDEDDSSETESARKTSPPSLRRQSVKGSSPLSSSSSQGSAKRRLTLDSEEIKEHDENNNPHDGLLSPSDTVFLTNDGQKSNAGEERRARAGSVDSDLPHPRHTERDGRIKSLPTSIDIPRLPKKPANHSEAMLLFDKYASVSDLRSSTEEHTTNDLSESDLDIAKELGDLTENSKIHRTVREVARAFSFSEYPDTPTQISPRGDEPREGRCLDELLESIDRELDETRRTINSAQLLESAIKLKQVKHLDIIWPPPANHEEENEVFKHDRVESNNAIEKNEPPSTQVRRSSSSSTQNQDVCAGDEEERDLKAEIAAFQKQSAQFSQLITEKHRTCSLDRRRNKRVFELSPRTNRFSTGNVNEDPDQHRSVHEMARQYSRKVKDEKAADIRLRLHSNSTSSIESQLQINASPKMKIERVTKVKFDTSLETSGVVRRRRKSGSRHKRSSWSHEDAKVDVDLLRLRIERPRSLHEIKPQKELIEVDCDFYDFADGLDEGLAPALLAGMEKDDVVVRGLVKHLVSKFGNDPQPQEEDQRRARLL